MDDRKTPCRMCGREKFSDEDAYKAAIEDKCGAYLGTTDSLADCQRHRHAATSARLGRAEGLLDSVRNIHLMGDDYRLALNSRIEAFLSEVPPWKS